MYNRGRFGVQLGQFRDTKPDDSNDKANGEKMKQKKERKDKQNELTQALLNAYSAIKPTIIQAQRI